MMKPWLNALCASLMLIAGGAAAAATEPASAPPAEAAAKPKVVMETSLGKLVIELYPEQAPVTVANFLAYVDQGFYNGVIFHRVVPNFVVQTGGFDSQYQRKNTRAPIVNESANGLRNLRGTLSMARTAAPDSASSQFFISLRDNPSLDWRPNHPGYAVFGALTEGLEVIDKMAEKPQGEHSGVFINAPNTPITITRAYRYSAPGADKPPAPPAAEPATP